MTPVAVVVAAGRAHLKARAETLYKSGLTVREVGRQLDVPATTVRRWVDPAYAERLREQSREAKRRRTGLCKLCGADTWLRRYGGVAADVCADCARDYYAPATSARTRGRGPVVDRLRALVADRPWRFTDLYLELGISAQHASVLLNRLVRHGLVERVGRGVYQTTKSVPVSAAVLPSSRRAEPSNV